MGGVGGAAAGGPQVRRPTLPLWILAGLLGLRLAVVAWTSIGTPSNGFVAHYAAARLLAEGADAQRFYDDDWFRGQVRRFEPAVADVFWANPPTMSLLVLPLAWADYAVARGAWIVGSVLLLAGTLAWLLRRLGIGGPWAPAFLSLALLAHPVRENVSHAQMYVVVLALLTAAWWGWRTSRETLLGAPLGFLLATKTAAFMVWPLLLVQRRWRALAWGGGTSLALVLASLPWIGFAAWRRYVTEAGQLGSEPLLAVTAFQTQLGFFRHLFGPGGEGVGAPVADLPLLAAGLPWLCAALLLGVSLFPVRGAGRSDAVFAAFVLLALIASPVSSEAHYATALLPLALLTSEWLGRGAPRHGAVLLAAGAFLIVFDLPFRSPLVADGLRALLAYPRLYGAILLWALAVTWSGGLRRDREASAAHDPRSATASDPRARAFPVEDAR